MAPDDITDPQAALDAVRANKSCRESAVSEKIYAPLLGRLCRRQYHERAFSASGFLTVLGATPRAHG